MNNLMLDLETLNTNYNSVMVQIGGIVFDDNFFDAKNDNPYFCCSIDFNKEIEAGFDVNLATVLWWLNQDIISIEHVFASPKIPLKEVLVKLNNFIKDNKVERIWCHKDFDLPILINHYKKSNIQFQFSYKKVFDLRTVVELSGFDKHSFDIEYNNLNKEGRHTTLGDCEYQITYLIQCLDLLKGKFNGYK